MYFIDGNNLARSLSKQFSEQTRRDLLTVLAQFARLRHSRVCVVFDGTPDRHFPDGSAFQGVKIFYAHHGSTADNRIRHLVEQNSNPRECIVVTNDRDLQMGVRVRQARVLANPEFMAQIDALIMETQRTQTEAKPQTRREEIQEWMRYFGTSPEEEHDDEDVFDVEVDTRLPGRNQRSNAQHKTPNRKGKKS